MTQLQPSASKRRTCADIERDCAAYRAETQLIVSSEQAEDADNTTSQHLSTSLKTKLALADPNRCAACDACHRKCKRGDDCSEFRRCSPFRTWFALQWDLIRQAAAMEQNMKGNARNENRN